MNMNMDMLAAPKKIVDGLTEVFQGFAQMFEGVSEQLALLAASAAEDEEKLLPVGTTLPPDKPLPADVSAKGVTVPRPRKKPVKRQKAHDAEPEETVSDPAEGDAQDDTAAAAEETAEDTEDNSLPADTADTPPWEDTSQKADTGQKEEPPDKAPGTDKPTEPPDEQKPRVPILTKDDITSVIVAKIKQKRSNNEKIGQLLKAYGVGALSDLPAEKYEAFLTDISQL